MKTVKSCIWMAAATMLVATLGACSNDDITAIQTPVQKGNVVTLTATLSPKDGETTRALTDPGDGTLTSAWAIGEELEVMYEDTHGGTPSARGKITAVDGSGKATVTVDLVDPQTGTAYFHYPYNRTSGLKDTKIDQIGALNDIGANFDEFEGNGTITVTAGVPSLPDDVALTRNVCVWKLKFTNGGLDITSDIISLSINDGTREYLITPSSLDAIYVAMFGCTGATITIKAATATGVYSASKAGITLQAGKSYHSTVALAAAAASDMYRVFTSKTDYSDEAIPGGATTVTDAATDVSWDAGTYVVSGDNVVISGGITLNGNVNLILKDGAKLTVNGIIDGATNTANMNIYGQTLGTGQLVVDSNGDWVDINVNDLEIHGGIINTINADQTIETDGVFKIYHGTINAVGPYNGIEALGDLHIYGGRLTATATVKERMGIECGGALVIDGGIITAIGGDATSDGDKGGDAISCSNITINGGTIIATGGNGYGSGNGGYGIYNLSMGTNITVNGGYVKSTGGAKGATGSDGKGIYEKVNVAGLLHIYEGDSANPSSTGTDLGKGNDKESSKRYIEVK